MRTLAQKQSTFGYKSQTGSLTAVGNENLPHAVKLGEWDILIETILHDARVGF